MSIPQDVMDRFGELMQSCVYDELVGCYSEMRKTWPGRLIALVIESDGTGSVYTESQMLSILNEGNAAIMKDIDDEEGTLLCVFVAKDDMNWFMSIALPDEDYGWISPGSFEKN